MKSLSAKYLIATSIVAVSAASASAQESAEQDTLEADVIVVTGVRGSLAAGLEQKRNADGFVDALVAQDIADFPDLNVTEALQRLPGVTINRVEGEGQQVNVRGLGPEFTRITLNGNLVTSGGGRDVDLDVFASELFTNVQLIKTPYAALTEGGLASTIDLRTARPFDYDGLRVAGTAQAYYNTLSEDAAPRASLLLSNTWGDKFGALVSVAYSESELRADAAEAQRYVLTDFTDRTDGAFGTLEHAGIPRSVVELRERERLGVTGALQFRPTSNSEFNVDIAYATFDEFRSRFSIDGLLLGGGFFPTDVTTSPNDPRYVTAGTFENVTSRTENVFDDLSDELFIVGAEGEIDLGSGWSVFSKFNYSKAEQGNDLFRVLYAFNGSFSYENIPFEGTQVPVFESNDFDFADIDAYSFNQSRFIDEVTEDKEVAFQGDIRKRFDDTWLTQVAGGFRYGVRTNDQSRFDGRLNASDVDTPPALSTIGELNPFGFYEDGPAEFVRDFPIVDFDLFAQEDSIFPPDFVPPLVPGGTFEVEETAIAGYLQADFDGDVNGSRVRGNVGVRVVNTDVVSDGLAIVEDGTEPVSVESSYFDILPSINVAAELRDDLIFRFASSRAITRPTLGNLGSGISSINPIGLTATAGNPTLDPFRVSQIDLGLEWYFDKEALISVTFFHKEIESFIANEAVNRQLGVPGPILNDVDVDVSQEVFEVSQPVNGDGSSITGFELAYQQPFTFLPAPFDGLGLQANYTYTDSEEERTFGGDVLTGPFLAQSEHAYNLIGYYEKHGVSVRMAYAYRSDFTNTNFGFSDTRRQGQFKGFGQLDLSASYQLLDNIALTLDVINLTDVTTVTISDFDDRGLEVQQTGRQLLGGVRFKF